MASLDLSTAVAQGLLLALRPMPREAEGQARTERFGGTVAATVSARVSSRATITFGLASFLNFLTYSKTRGAEGTRRTRSRGPEAFEVCTSPRRKRDKKRVFDKLKSAKLGEHSIALAYDQSREEQTQVPHQQAPVHHRTAA